MDEYKRRRRRSRAVMSMFLDSLGGSIDNVDVAEFDSDGSDLKALIVGIDPVQDLHGYDAPWPSGGGKNLLDPSQRTTTSYNAYFYKNTGFLLKANQAYTLTAYSSGNASGVYFKSYPENETLLVKYNANTATYTPTEDVTAWFEVYYATAPTEGTANINVQLELGSTSTDFAPYSNICPIYGHTDADVTRTGGSIFDDDFLRGYWAFADGAFAISDYWLTTNKLPCKPSTQYTATADNRMTRYQGFVWFDSNGTFISASSDNTNQPIGYTATSPNNAAYLVFNVAGYPGTTSPILPTDVHNFKIVESTIYPIPLGTTVYGGQLDVLTGVLTDADAEIASYNGETINEPWMSSMDAYSPGATPTTGAQVVYPLATPTTIQLTGQQIATFLGTNHVWCDSGKIIHLEY